MRLECLDTGHRLPQKLTMAAIRLVTGRRLPDVVRTLMYRPEFFGRPFSALVQTLLRESGQWSAGECELFAAFVSRKNQCAF